MLRPFPTLRGTSSNKKGSVQDDDPLAHAMPLSYHT
jgi:hypothetical protein